jgi:hypothetical protein
MTIELSPEYKIMPANFARELIQVIATAGGNSEKSIIDVGLYDTYMHYINILETILKEHPEAKEHLEKRRKKYDLAIASLKTKKHIKRHIKTLEA